jgi:hypothetical protein
MRTVPPRRRDAGPTWLAWWVFWAAVLFWPLLLGGALGIALEILWLALGAGAAWLAVTGRRAGRRPRP